MSNKNNMPNITNSQILYSKGVAERCYEIAEKCNETEDFCKKMYMVGLVHNIGGTPQQTVRMLRSSATTSYGFNGTYCGVRDNNEILEVIKSQNKVYENNFSDLEYYNDELYFPIMYEILNLAKLMVDKKGNKIPIEKKLNLIKKEYGAKSDYYKTQVKKVNLLKKSITYQKASYNTIIDEEIEPNEELSEKLQEAIRNKDEEAISQIIDTLNWPIEKRQFVFQFIIYNIFYYPSFTPAPCKINVL